MRATHNASIRSLIPESTNRSRAIGQTFAFEHNQRAKGCRYRLLQRITSAIDRCACVQDDSVNVF